MISLISPLQFFFLPATIAIVVWFVYRTLFKRDIAAGIVLALGLVVVVDEFMIEAIFIPGLTKGSIRYDEVLITFLLFFMARNSPREKDPQGLAIYRLAQSFLIIYILLYFFAALRSDEFIHAVFYRFRRLGFFPFLIFLIGAKGLETLEDYKRLGFYLMIFAFILSVASAQMIFFDKYFISNPITENKFYDTISHSRRFGSFYGNPNHFGGFLVLTFPIFLTLFHIVKRTSIKIIIFIALILILFAFIKTYSRGSYIGFAFAIILLLFFTRKLMTFRQKAALFIIIPISILVFTPNIYNSVINRIQTIQQETSEVDYKFEEEGIASRPYIWENTLTIIKMNPFLGVGEGTANYRLYLSSITDKMDPATIELLAYLEHPHNSYLYISLFFGNIALIFFILFLVVYYKASFSFLRSAVNREIKLIALGMLCGISGYLVTIFFDYQLFVKGSCTPFWAILGANFSIFINNPPLPQDTKTS